SISIFNSIWMGWKEGIRMDGENTLNKLLTDSAFIQNNIIAGCVSNYKEANGADLTSFVTYMQNPAQSNRELSETVDVMLNDPYNYSSPDWTPKAGSPALTGASFTNAKLATGFTSTTYVGAFAQNDTW